MTSRPETPALPGVSFLPGHPSGPNLEFSWTAMNHRPTSTPSFGPLARHIGPRRDQRGNDEISPTTTRLQGRAAWFRLFPSDGDEAQSGRKERRSESASA
jgi:hypothetical protein